MSVEKAMEDSLALPVKGTDVAESVSEDDRTESSEGTPVFDPLQDPSVVEENSEDSEGSLFVSAFKVCEATAEVLLNEVE